MFNMDNLYVDEKWETIANLKRKSDGLIGQLQKTEDKEGNIFFRIRTAPEDRMPERVINVISLKDTRGSEWLSDTFLVPISNLNNG